MIKFAGIGRGMHFTSLKAKILLSVIIAVVVIEGIFLYLNIRSLQNFQKAG
jgi:hypothetical protein